MDGYGVRKMKILIHGAKTLTKFTNELLSGFDSAEGEDYSFELFQFHASPNSLNEDLEILEKFKLCKLPKIILIHRPDELLLNNSLRNFFERYSETKIILLGDLVLQDPFWKSRETDITIIPHFYFSLTLPPNNVTILGSYTSWGEMRDVRHFENLVFALKNVGSNVEIDFRIGGTLNGELISISNFHNADIQVVDDFFIPHFNIQLYHLNGKKRLGESSGSLHTGISIPIIFEANGMERIEEIHVVKIEASEDLTNINYEKAAREIVFAIENKVVDKLIASNLKSARLNTSVDFANQVISIVTSY